jgi:hypothetical protein
MFGGRSRYQKPLQNGDDIRDDGFVWRDEKPAFKWYEKITPECSDKGLFIWPPNLNDIKRIEAARWRALQKLVKFWDQHYPKFLELFREAKVAYHVHPKDSKYLNRYTYHSRNISGEETIGGGLTRIDEVDEILNTELGAEYYAFEYTHVFHYCHRHGMLREVLNRAFEKQLPKLDRRTARNAAPVRFQVNGRYYWFVVEKPKYGGWQWKKLHWPDEELQKINLDE